MNAHGHLVPFDPFAASAGEWSRFHRYRRRRHDESRPEDPALDDTTVERSLCGEAGDPEFEAYRFAIVDAARPGDQIGGMSYGFRRPSSPSYAENRESAHVQIAVLAPWRRRGVGRLALGYVRDIMRRHGHTVALGSTSEDDGLAFARAIGADEALAGRESRLALAAVDWGMVERWIAEGAARSPGTTLSVVEPVPDDWLAPLSELYTETFNQRPRGESAAGDVTFTPETMRQWGAHMASMGGRQFVAVLREADGALSGLTEMIHLAGRPTLIQQGLTGVRDAYRGRGNGKWLKAAMLAHMRRGLPDVRVVVTDNATTNAPMLGINARLGFRLHRTTTDVQIGLEALEAYLG